MIQNSQNNCSLVKYAIAAFFALYGSIDLPTLTDVHDEWISE